MHADAKAVGMTPGTAPRALVVSVIMGVNPAGVPMVRHAVSDSPLRLHRNRWLLWATRVALLVLVTFVTVIVLAVSFLLAVFKAEYIPDNAIVYIDDQLTYYSPPIVAEDQREFHIATPVGVARSQGLRNEILGELSALQWDKIANKVEFVWVCNRSNTWRESRPTTGICLSPVTKGSIRGKREYNPDQKSVDEGGFWGETRPLGLHLLGAYKKRWNTDGSWRW
ncbi:MAG: hypothetical protein SF069_17835 [Phycisphaerae bacterium]|nr:hypothetical protein [Phycisphaerae bacterium]